MSPSIRYNARLVAETQPSMSLAELVLPASKPNINRCMTNSLPIPVDTSKTPVADALDQSNLLCLLGYQLRRADVAMGQIFSHHVSKPFKLTQVEFSILMLLLNNQEVTQKRLSQALNVVAPNLAVIVDKLEARKLVKRIANPNDGRSTYLTLSKNAVKLAQSAQAAIQAAERELLQDLGQIERDTLLDVLTKLHGLRPLQKDESVQGE